MKILKPVLVTGLIAGTLDLAGGVFGKDALTGGISKKLSGLFFHYFIAFVFTLFYFLIYPKIKLLAKKHFF